MATVIRFSQPERRERRRKVAAAIRGGKSVAEAALEFAVSAHTVKLACREHGVALPPVPPRPRSSRTFAILADLLNTADATGEIARRHNTSETRVYGIRSEAVAAGIRVPDRGEAAAAPGAGR